MFRSAEKKFLQRKNEESSCFVKLITKFPVARKKDQPDFTAVILKFGTGNKSSNVATLLRGLWNS